MHLRRSGFCVVLTVLLGCACTSSCAQVDVSAWPQVQMEVLALDEAGGPVAGLTPQAVQVRGTGKPRAIVDLIPTSEAQSVCVLVDASDPDRLSLVKSKASRLIKNLPPGDEVCVAAFASDMTVVQEFTRDRRAATGALESIRAMGGTRLRDGLLRVADYMRGRSQHPSRAVILFSDGTDHASGASKQQLRQGLEVAGSPVVHMVVLPAAFGHARAKQFDPAEGAAFQLTGLSGGLAYFPHTMGDMNGLVEALPEAMRSRYVLTYVAENTKRDGHEERLEIFLDKMHRSEKVRVQAPEGFYAPSQ